MILKSQAVWNLFSNSKFVHSYRTCRAVADYLTSIAEERVSFFFRQFVERNFSIKAIYYVVDL